MASPPSNPSGPLHNPQWRHQLDQIVSEVLNDEQKNLYHILPFIEWKLRSCGLQHKYDARDIFLESYERAVKAIERQEVIRHLPAWFKATSFNIIREYARKAGKLKMTSLDNQQLANVPAPCISDEILEAEVSWLLDALKQLKPEDQALLEMRMQGYSYEEIVRQRGGTVTALRQKVSRLLKQLRQSAKQLDA